MTNELVTQNYMALLHQDHQDEELAELAQEADIFKVMPKLCLSKDTKEIRAIQNEESVATFSSRDPLYFVVMSFSEHRALWRPESAEDTDERFPVCSTGRLPIGTFRRDHDRGVGLWNVKSNQDLPCPALEGDQVTVACATCRMNAFGSMKEWDTQRGGEGKGKACGEGRLIVGFPCVKIREIESGLSIFEFNPDSTMMYMQVSSTSIASVKAMGTACVARQVPPRYSVFQLGCLNDSSGQMKWGTLTQEFAGFIAEQLLGAADQKAKELREMIFVNKVGPDIATVTQFSPVSSDTPDSSDTPVNTANYDLDDIPF